MGTSGAIVITNGVGVILYSLLHPALGQLLPRLSRGFSLVGAPKRWVRELGRLLGIGHRSARRGGGREVVITREECSKAPFRFRTQLV